MARREALLRLHKTLLERRDHLRKKLAEDLAALRDFPAEDGTGDSADAAFESGSDEMASHLAELDARELSQIEGALARLKQGAYGVCESCQTKIPVARLNALPYTALCIECQRELEKYPGWQDRRSVANWEHVVDADRLLGDQPDLKLSDLEIDLSHNR
jgi:DnaK suppressor protein